MSPTLINQSILERFDLGLKKELEVSKHLAVLYGGLLMENAAFVEHHWPIDSGFNAQANASTPRLGGLGDEPTGMLGYPNNTTVSQGNFPTQHYNPACEPLPTQHYTSQGSTSLPPDPVYSAPKPWAPSTLLGLQPSTSTMPGYTFGGWTPMQPRPTSTGTNPTDYTQPVHSFGPGFIHPQPSVNPPLQGVHDASFQNTVCHHLDRLANPDTQTASKDGTLESTKRMGRFGYSALVGSTRSRYFCAPASLVNN